MRPGEKRRLVGATTQLDADADGTLRLARPSKSDEGLVACQATNGVAGPIVKTIRIRVYGETLFFSSRFAEFGHESPPIENQFHQICLLRVCK